MADSEKDYQGPERRKWIRVSNAERSYILRQAARAAEDFVAEATRGLADKTVALVLQNVKVQVGDVAIRIVLYALGVGGLATLLWLFAHEKVSFGIGG